MERQERTPTWTPSASIRSLRLTQNICGLFDTGSTDAVASLERLPSVEFPSDLLSSDDATLDEMFAALEKGSMATGDVAPSNTRLPSDTSDLLSLDGDFNFMQNSSEFCEVFTDIDQLLLDAQPSTSTAEGVNPLKRTAAVLLDDHNDYTLKKSRIETTEKEPVSTKEKYLERRRKNNVASQRSRAKRKQKNSELIDQAAELEERNAELRRKVEDMEILAKEMKSVLIQTLAHKKK
jgi:hypothetical protein